MKQSKKPDKATVAPQPYGKNRLNKKLTSASSGVKKTDKSSIKEKNLSELNEPASGIAYNITGIVYWLGGSARIRNEIRTDFEMIKYSMAGLTKASVDALTHYIGVSKKWMAEEILNVSVKTLERKKADGKLDTKTSSHVMEVARIMQHAFEVFEGEEKAKQWLNRENSALNNLKPVQLLNTLTGINMVNDVLIRIEEGVYS